MQIYIHRDNQQLGPFTEAQVKAQLASSTISLQDHVWWEGQANWIPLGQSPLMATLSAASPGSAPVVPAPVPGATAPAPTSTAAPETSKLAIWALVSGCLSLLSAESSHRFPRLFSATWDLPEIKKNPTIQGRGMALAGTILGYLFTALIGVLYLIAIIVLIALGNQVKGTFNTIDAQLNAAQGTNSADQSTNSPGTRVAPATTNSSDQSTNSAPATPASTDSSTNAPASTNAAPMSQ